MSPSRLELATRQPGIPRCLVVAEAEHDQNGVALAVLLHDPTGVSPHWALAAATCQELKRGDARSRARELDQRLPELALDPDLVFAVLTIEGTTLSAWALPAASLLVFQGGSTGELELQGFSAVPAAESIRRGLERPGWRSGSIAVAPGMSFCLMPRAALARAGYRAFTTALAATPSSAVLAAVELAGAATPVIAGRLGAVAAGGRPAGHEIGIPRDMGNRARPGCGRLRAHRRPRAPRDPAQRGSRSGRVALGSRRGRRGPRPSSGRGRRSRKRTCVDAATAAGPGSSRAGSPNGPPGPRSGRRRSRPGARGASG